MPAGLGDNVGCDGVRICADAEVTGSVVFDEKGSVRPDNVETLFATSGLAAGRVGQRRPDQSLGQEFSVRQRH